MKKSRIPILITLFILGSFVLSACSGAPLVNSWPGLAASEDTVYLANAGQIYAIDAQKGSLTCKFPKEADNSKPFFAPPAVTEDLVVAGSYGHTLYGLSKGCGQDQVLTQQWAFDSKDGNFAGTPLVIGDTVVAPASNNRVYAVSALDGKPLWSFETNNVVWAKPASDGKIVYQPALDHHLYALNLADGKLIWDKNLGSALLSAPILTEDGMLYLTTLRGELVALKATDGSEVWRAETGGGVWSSPVLHEDVLYVGNEKGKVVAVSAKDGKVTGEKDLGSPVFGGGALIEDGIVFPTEGGAVVALSLDLQRELWRQTISGKLYSTPAVAGQMLTVAVLEGDNLAQAYQVNGTVSWPFVAPK